MPRSYHTAAAAFAIGRTAKWLDNVLSRYEIVGIPRKTRGTSRAIPADTLIILRIASDLCADLDISVPRALELATTLVENGDGLVVLSSGLSLQVDRTRVRRALDQRLIESAETHLRASRGRRPARERHSKD